MAKKAKESSGDILPLEIISRDDAISKGLIKYFTGIPCKNGHISEIYVNRNVCKDCKLMWERNTYRKDSSKHKERVKRYINKIGIKEYKLKGQEYRRINKQKLYKQSRLYREKYPEKYKEFQRTWQKNRRDNDPYFRISSNIGHAIWKNLKQNKGGKKWESFVKFTLDELILHLEKQFDSKMTWDNYGSYWHVDHIKPLAKFNLKLEFDDAWSINNLQPLEAIANITKRDKYE